RRPRRTRRHPGQGRARRDRGRRRGLRSRRARAARGRARRALSHGLCHRSETMDTATRHLRLLSDVVAAVTATLDLDEVLQRVAESVAGALDADACFVYVLDELRDELVLGASVGVAAERGSPAPHMRVGEGITGHVARTREPLALARDAHLDPRFKRFPNL